MIVAYIAHALGAPTPEDMERNRQSAEAWGVWLARYCDVAPVFTWTTLSRHWPETPENQGLGLLIDVELVKRCDCVIATGSRISEGMKLEMSYARHTVNATGWALPCAAFPGAQARTEKWFRSQLKPRGLANHGL